MKEENQTGEDRSRREFVKKAGKLALYTPPAMVMLSRPSASAASSSNSDFSGGSTSTSGGSLLDDEFSLFRAESKD